MTKRTGPSKRTGTAYRAIFNSSPFGMITLDGGLITDANPGAARALGYAPGALVGTAFDGYCPVTQPGGTGSIESLESLCVEASVEGTASSPWQFSGANGGTLDTLLTVSRLSDGADSAFLLSFGPHLSPGTGEVPTTPLDEVRDALRDLATGELDGRGLSHLSQVESSPGRAGIDDEVRDLLLLCGERLRALSGETGRLAAEAGEGNLATRGDAGAHPGAYGRIVGDVNLVLESIGEPVAIAGRFIDDLSHGRRLAPIEGEYRGEFEALVRRLNRCFDTYIAVHTETGRLADAAVRGALDERIDDGLFEGSWKALVQGMNGTLDAVVGPLRVAEDYIARIARGEIPDPITDEYRGDFNEVRNNLNTCIENIRTLVEDTQLLAEAGVAGSLSTRADPERVQGEYRRIVQGMNALLDAVAEPVRMASRFIEDLSHGRRLEPVSGE